MRRAIVVGVISAALVAGVAWATQVWRDNENMGGFSLTDPTHAGSGPLCAQYDNTGKLTSAGAPCSSGGGAVSSVTGTAAHILASPTTGAVVVDLIATAVTPGSYTYAAFTVDADGRLTAASSGTAPVTSVTGTSPVSCSGSPTATCSITGGAKQIQVGTGSNIGGFSDFLFDDSATQMAIGETSIPAFAANLDILTASGPGGLTTHTTSTGSADFTGFIAYLGSSLTAPPYVQFFVPVLANTGFGPSGSVIFDAATSGSGQLRLGNSVAGAGVDLYTGGAIVGRTTRMHLASAGDWDYVAMGAPSTPATGIAATWVDSTAKNLFVKNDAGTVNHGAQDHTSVSGVALSGLNADGSWNVLSFQPPLSACVDYVSVGCQGPTSDITGSSNAAVQNVALHDGAGTRLPIQTLTADQELIRNGSSQVASVPRGQVRVTGSDTTSDYLGNKVTSPTGTVAISTPSVGTMLGLDVKLTERDYAIQAAISASVAATSLFAGGNGFGASTGIFAEYPNSFQAGHIQITAYMKTNTITGGTVSYFATLNGSTISGTTFAFTSATSPGVHSISVTATGSTSTSDTIGLAFSTSVGFTESSGQITTFQMVLTP